MLVALPLLLACQDGAAATGSAGPRVHEGEWVSVVATVPDDGGTAAWTASWWPHARVVAPDALPEGRCERVRSERDVVAVEPSRLPARVHLRGGLAGSLLRRGDAWTTPLAGRIADPAWAVADLALTWGDAVQVEEGAVRLGPAPRPVEVAREEDGDVRLVWAAGSVDEARVVTGDAGGADSHVCGAGPEGVVLPWWTVPARGGRVRIESTRVRAVDLGDRARFVRATVARWVVLDAPLPGTPSPQPGSRGSAAPEPTRPVRRPPPTRGAG
jgi:hypothetical protein